MLGKRRYAFCVVLKFWMRRVELKLEALTGGVLKSAFNNFPKFTVKHLCWSLSKVAELMVCNFFKKKTLAQVFCCKFSEIFKKAYFVEHARTDAWVKWTKKKIFTKSIHRETPVVASFLVQLQTSGLTVFPKKDSIADVFPWKLESFTEYRFHRTMLRGCFWFPVTYSMYYLPYQW